MKNFAEIKKLANEVMSLEIIENLVEELKEKNIAQWNGFFLVLVDNPKEGDSLVSEGLLYSGGAYIVGKEMLESSEGIGHEQVVKNALMRAELEQLGWNKEDKVIVLAKKVLLSARGKAILAHEIGHGFLGHLICIGVGENRMEYLNKRNDNEVEADYFAYCVVGEELMKPFYNFSEYAFNLLKKDIKEDAPVEKNVALNAFGSWSLAVRIAAFASYGICDQEMAEEASKIIDISKNWLAKHIDKL